ncbi:hypothetical protein COOONC_17260 [Cooperia oncophora]
MLLSLRCKPRMTLSWPKQPRLNATTASLANAVHTVHVTCATRNEPASVVAARK